jgi:hypothetical protein
VPELLLLGTAHAPVELDLSTGLERDAAVPQILRKPLPTTITDEATRKGSMPGRGPLERAGGIGPVQGREDQVARERRLDPDASRLGVTHLADEDDVRSGEDPQSTGR